MQTLKDMKDIFGGERKISLCRELTKKNEETMRTTLANAVSYYEENEPRGEYVLVLEGCEEAYGASGIPNLETEARASLPPEEHVFYFTEQGLSRMDAIKAAARERGMTKSELYKILNS